MSHYVNLFFTAVMVMDRGDVSVEIVGWTNISFSINSSIIVSSIFADFDSLALLLAMCTSEHHKYKHNP